MVYSHTQTLWYVHTHKHFGMFTQTLWCIHTHKLCGMFTHTQTFVVRLQIPCGVFTHTCNHTRAHACSRILTTTCAHVHAAHGHMESEL